MGLISTDAEPMRNWCGTNATYDAIYLTSLVDQGKCVMEPLTDADALLEAFVSHDEQVIPMKECTYEWRMYRKA